jgi:type II secretory pathway pseudopilin PulG
MEKKASRSFTVVELLVVITTIAILALIAYPAYTSVQERAKATADMNNLRQIGLATQMYMNDNDGVVFSTGAGAGTWMSQLQPKYVPAWKVFQSPFDPRASSEKGDLTTPVSYGLNGNNKAPGSASIAGLLNNKIANPSAFILFAPAQTSAAIVTFSGTAVSGAPGVTVYKTTSNPGGTATGGTHSSRKRINAVFADSHTESMLWSKFILDTDPNDASAAQRWDPYLPYP